MRIASLSVICGLSLFAVNALAAKAPPALTADTLSYYRDNACPEDKPIEGLQASEVLSMDEFFASEGLIGTNSQFGQGQLIFEVDEIYADDDLNTLVLTKFCLEPLNVSDLGQVVEMPDGDFLYHAKTRGGLPYALYFVGLTRSAVEAKTAALEAAISKAPDAKDPTKTSYLEGASSILTALNPANWIDAAWAGVDHNFAQEIQRMQQLRERRRIEPESADKSEKKLEEGKAPPTKKDTLRDVFGNVASCMKGIGKGVYNATVGVVEYAARSIFSFVKSAAFALRHPKEAWQSVSKGAKDVASVIRNFSITKFAKKGTGGFKAMPTALKTEFICRLIAQVGVASAMAIFAAPTISAQGILLWQVLARYKTLGKFQQWFFDQAPAGVKAGSKGK
jgi:hypothetical protein